MRPAVCKAADHHHKASVPLVGRRPLPPFWRKLALLVLLSLFQCRTVDTKKSNAPTAQNAPPLHVHWFAPFWSGGGYSSEAIGFAEALEGRVSRLKISQHGDSISDDFMEGIPKKLRRRLDRLHETRVDSDRLVTVCHAEPGAWNVGDGARYRTTPCPPFEEPLYTIGRTMFETNRIPSDWVDRCNKMDEIWVPTDFHRGTFIEAGVIPSKVVVIPEPVDVTRFNPERRGVVRIDDFAKVAWFKGHALGGDVASYAAPINGGSETKIEQEFRFLSIFKWEERKGWKILLEAFVAEFTAAEHVSLTLITNKFHTDDNLMNQVEQFVVQQATSRGLRSIPMITIVDQHVPESKMPSLYRSMDAFVLPSRGEGWGRPHVEAMAMGLPVIATNWSGPTAFMTEDNSFPLPIDGLVTVASGAFRKFHKWAEPSRNDLRRLMRHVVNNPSDALKKGARARADMVSRFTPQHVADLVVSRLEHIYTALQEDGAL